MVVNQEFEKEGFNPIEVRMGEVELNKMPKDSQLKKLNSSLKKLGFEILDNQKQKLIERIKNLLIEKIQTGQIEGHFMLSDFLSKNLTKEYSHVSRLFSGVEGITVEQFFILQKIEKVKEWIAYAELTLSEIAWKLGYSSVAHLSSQFKNVTGLTPTNFKKSGVNHRKSLDNI